MAMIACRTCGHSVSRQAESCPSCGHAYPGLLASCPECRGDEIGVVKQGFRAGEAAGAALLLGPIGALAGAAGMGSVQLHCGTCEHTWTPTKEEIVHAFREQEDAARVLKVRAAKEAKESVAKEAEMGRSVKIALYLVAIGFLGATLGMWAAYLFIAVSAFWYFSNRRGSSAPVQGE